MKHLSSRHNSILTIFITCVVSLGTGCTRDKQTVQPATAGSHHLAGTYVWKVTQQDRDEMAIWVGTYTLNDTVFSITTLNDTTINVLGARLFYRNNRFTSGGSNIILAGAAVPSTYKLSYTSDSIFFTHQFSPDSVMIRYMSYHAARN